MLAGHLWMNWLAMEERAHRMMAGLLGPVLQARMVTNWEDWALKAALGANTELTVDMVQMEGPLGSRDPRDNFLMIPPAMGVLQMVKHSAGPIQKMLLDKVLVQTEDTLKDNWDSTPQTEKVLFRVWDLKAKTWADQIPTML